MTDTGDRIDRIDALDGVRWLNVVDFGLVDAAADGARDRQVGLGVGSVVEAMAVVHAVPTADVDEPPTLKVRIADTSADQASRTRTHQGLG